MIFMRNVTVLWWQILLQQKLKPEKVSKIAVGNYDIPIPSDSWLRSFGESSIFDKWIFDKLHKSKVSLISDGFVVMPSVCLMASRTALFYMSVTRVSSCQPIRFRWSSLYVRYLLTCSLENSSSEMTRCLSSHCLLLQLQVGRIGLMDRLHPRAGNKKPLQWRVWLVHFTVHVDSLWVSDNNISCLLK